MSATAFRRRAIYASDVRSLGGVVQVVPCRSHTEPADEPSFRVEFASRGRDLTWSSPPIADEDQARACGRLLAAFVGGVVV
jgi:hypothetical protein